MVIKAEQQLDQLAGAHHLGNQIQGHHHQRTAGGEGADRPLLQAVRGDIGKSIAAKIAQTFSN